MKKILCIFSLLLVCQFAAAAPPPAIVVLGDSLSAAYGMRQNQGWVALLETRLEEEGYPHTVRNASISGETSAGGLRRLPALLEKHQPEIVVLELGANDGLRALSVDVMRANLEKMVDQSQTAGASVLLLGMRIPSNYGPVYTDAFRGVFKQVAQEKNIGLVEFFLEPVALKPEYFQADRIHPNAKAQPLLFNHVWPTLKDQLDGSEK